MDIQTIVAFATGVLFLIALLIIACYMAFRTAAGPIPAQAMFIFRVILALTAAAFSVALTGLLQVEGKVFSLTIKATGSLAVFFLVYLVNPPEILEKSLPKPRKPRSVAVPQSKIDGGDK